jgi:hypothetical protein
MSMIHLRRAALTAVLATAACGLAASPASSADPLAPCDATAAPGLQWSAPSFLAWGREARIGANVADPGAGPGYDDGSVALSVDAGSASEAADPVAADVEFVLKAPSRGAVANAAATWAMIDEAGTARCAQSTALSVPLGSGKELRFHARAVGGSGITWVPVGAGDCHDVALEPISLTVSQGGATRRLGAPDECHPAGDRRIATPDWELTLAGGQFHLRALKPHSSLKTRLRYALRVGSRRVSSGSLSLVRAFRPARLIIVSDPAFQSQCVGHFAPQWFGAQVGCKIPGSFSLRLALA